MPRYFCVCGKRTHVHICDHARGHLRVARNNDGSFLPTVKAKQAVRKGHTKDLQRHLLPDRQDSYHNFVNNLVFF